MLSTELQPITPRSAPQGEMGIILASMDSMAATIIRIEDRQIEHGERLAATCARMEAMATRAEISGEIDEHQATCDRNKMDMSNYAKSIGIILGALSALVAAIAAAYNFTH